MSHKYDVQLKLTGNGYNLSGPILWYHLEQFHHLVLLEIWSLHLDRFRLQAVFHQIVPYVNGLR